MKQSRYPSAALLEARRTWSRQFQHCWICQRPAEHVHEIASRAQAPGRWADERNYLRACAVCNLDLLEWLPEAAQLAMKLLYDPENYDRLFVNQLRGRAENAITESVVQGWAKLLRRT